MTEDELIELLQQRLPQDLTAAQIDQLRRTMKTSPRLREALLAELTLEQSLATKYAPPVEKAEEVVARIIRAAAARRAARRRTWGLGFGVLILAAVAGVYVAAQLSRRNAQPAAPAGGAGSIAATTRPAAPTTQPDAEPDTSGGAVVANAGGDASIPQPTTVAVRPVPVEPNSEPAAAPGAEPAWRLFTLPERVNGLSLAAQLSGLFKNGPKISGRAEERNLSLRGRWELAEPLTAGRLIRFAVEDIRRFGIEAWRGESGVEFGLDREGYARGFLLRRVGKQTVRRAAARDACWDTFRRGALDLRCQDGQLLLARGDVVLLALPLGGEPEKVFLDAECRLALLYDRDCGPLAIPQTRPPDVLDEPAPADFVWSVDGLRGATLRRGAGGSVTLSAGSAKDGPETVVEWPYVAGRQVEMRLGGLSDQAGFAFRVQDGRRSMAYSVGEHKGVRVVCSDPRNSGRREEALARGFVVDGEFWVRLTMGIDQIELDLSDDGVHWGRLAETRLDEGAPADGQVRFALRLARLGGRSSASVTGMRIRQMRRLTGLADEALVRRVPRGGGGSQVRLFTQAIEKLVAARPEKTAPWRWRIACDVALLRRSPWVAVRRLGARDALATAGANIARLDANAVIAAAEELPAMLVGDYNRDLHSYLAQVYDEAARQCFAAGRRDLLAPLAGSWVFGVLPAGQRRWEPQADGPRELVRLAACDLHERRRWGDLADMSGRLVYLHRSPGGEVTGDDGPGGTLRLARWTHHEARAGLRRRGEAPMAWSADWAHPLSVQTDREAMNVVAEFVAAVEAKAYGQAVKVLAGQTLPDGIMPIGDDGDLHQAIGVRVRQMIAASPELSALVAGRLSEVGAVRLSRALRDSDAAALEALAVQFYGTDASLGALEALADRDLSMGNVLAAAGKYSRLIERLDGPRRAACRAKHRLACALAGELAGEPATRPVELPGRTQSPQEFEKMIRSLVRSRQGGAVAVSALPDAEAAPPAKAGELDELGTIDAHRDDRHSPMPKLLGWAGAARDVLLNPRGVVTVLNMDGRRTRWVRGHSPRGAAEGVAAASRPLAAGRRFYVRLRGRESSLACFDGEKGEPVWTCRFDEGVLSDPVLANGWLYVATCRTALTGQADIHLCRISPQTGQCALSARLVGVGRDRRLLETGRLALAGDRLLLRCAGAAVCCDLTGEVQWIRRLTYVPPDVDPSLLADRQPGDIAVHGSTAIFAAHCSPDVFCVDIKTGSLVWSSLQPNLARLVGVVGDTVVLAEPGAVAGLDAATGKRLWRSAGPPESGAVMPAADETVLCVRLDKAPRDAKAAPEAEGAVRRAWWLSAADGREVGSVPLYNPRFNEGLHDVVSLHATPKEVVGLAGYDRGKAQARIFRLRVK